MRVVTGNSALGAGAVVKFELHDRYMHRLANEAIETVADENGEFSVELPISKNTCWVIQPIRNKTRSDAKAKRQAISKERSCRKLRKNTVTMSKAMPAILKNKEALNIEEKYSLVLPIPSYFP